MVSPLRLPCELGTVAKLNYFSRISSSEEALDSPNSSYFLAGKWSSMSWLMWVLYLFLVTDCLWEGEETCWIKRELRLDNHRNGLYRRGSRDFWNEVWVTTKLWLVLPFLIYHQVVPDKIDRAQSCTVCHFCRTFPTILYNIPPHCGE